MPSYKISVPVLTYMTYCDIEADSVKEAKDLLLQDIKKGRETYIATSSWNPIEVNEDINTWIGIFDI